MKGRRKSRRSVQEEEEQEEEINVDRVVALDNPPARSCSTKRPSRPASAASSERAMRPSSLTSTTCSCAIRPRISATVRPGIRGLHSSTSQLNLSRF